MRIACTALLISGLLAAGGAVAGEADVVDASVERNGDSYTFTVTVKHADTGWEHYADRWQVLAPDGTVLGERTLLHPHENEQPFTRSLSGVVIPEGIEAVTIRAGDKIHGLGSAELVVKLPAGEG